MVLSPHTINALRKSLLAWFDEVYRDLPWRGINNPYATWISEIMLQQTQVQTVIDYYERWMTRFPDVHSLAVSDREQVLEAWAGLGYYRRARMLHEAAQLVVSQYGGELPQDVLKLKKLPGIGDYTAGAIASIAFQKREPLVDGNVIRVLSRLFAIDEDPTKGSGKKYVWQLARELVDPDRPGDFNQSLMELGATLCTPRQPACRQCPVGEHCAAFHDDRVQDYPRLPKRAKPRRYSGRVAIVRTQTDAGIKYLVKKRPDNGVLAGLWEFPLVVESGARTPNLSVLDRAIAEMLTDGLAEASFKRTTLGQIKHQFSHLIWHLAVEWRGYFIDQLRIDRAIEGVRWVDDQALHQLPMPRVMRKAEQLYRQSMACHADA